MTAPSRRHAGCALDLRISTSAFAERLGRTGAGQCNRRQLPPLGAWVRTGQPGDGDQHR
jgi:hypothetical protein